MTEDLKLHKNIRISGRVQGVGFRYSARKVAESFGIKGYIKNLADETVYIEAEGNPAQLDYFTEWCRHGPARAEVTVIQIEESEVIGFKRFEVRY